MSLIQLICYLGGLAGLWLGVSVMTVSGWLTQLYPFMQKWKVKQRFILLSVTRNMKYILDSAKNFADKHRSNGGYQQAKVSITANLPNGEEVEETNGIKCGFSNHNHQYVSSNHNHHHHKIGSLSQTAICGCDVLQQQHREPTPILVKQSSVTSTITDIDSGLSSESKTYLDEPYDEPDELVDGDDDQARIINITNQLGSEENNNNTINSGISKTNNSISSGISNNNNHHHQGFQVYDFTDYRFNRASSNQKLRRHSMAHAVFSSHCYNAENNNNTTNKFNNNQQSSTKQTSFSLCSSTTINNFDGSTTSTISQSKNQSSKLIKEKEKDHRWPVARGSVYWSNYSSMSTSSDDLSLISNNTTSTVTNSSISGISAVATIALRRMSLVNSKFSCKV